MTPYDRASPSEIRPAQLRIRRAATYLRCAAFALALAILPTVTYAQSDGVTEPTVFPAFDAAAPGCAPPVGLRRLVGFARDNDREFMGGVSRGLAAAARERGLEYEETVARNSASNMIEQLRRFASVKAGAVVVAPVDPSSSAHSVQELIWSGVYVGSIVPPPATSLLNAPQYLTGKSLGDAAAAYIRAELGGRAKVVLLTHDSLQFLSPRFAAIRDSLKSLSGVTIVADITPLTVDKAGGRAMMKTIMMAQPTIDVVLGADTVVLGALEALREAGQARPNQFLGGIDGEPEAVAEIKKGGPYKATVTLASSVFGYAMGQHAADWLEGKSIPQAMDILPRTLTSATVAEYESDLSDPRTVYSTVSKRDRYLRMYGSICYETRERYVNFPWSSERGLNRRR